MIIIACYQTSLASQICNIKIHFHNEKKFKVRKGIKPGNNKTLWEAVKLAKDVHVEDLPDQMNNDGKPIPNDELAEEFATMFEEKIRNITTTTRINDTVYNGSRKITETDKNFMTPTNVKAAILNLKLKNSEGYDRIPQRILIDGISILLEPLEKLFHLIYTTNTIPEQWAMSKITPIYKKGDKNNIKNYRPISNLCSMSKI